MKLGQVDIATVSSGNVGAFGTTFDIINLPYIFKDAETANKITTAWLGKELSQRAEKDMKVHVIAIVPVGGFRNVVNTQREARSADLKGLKIRVTKSPTEFNLVKPGAQCRSRTTGRSSTRACSRGWCRACTCRTRSPRPASSTRW
jgi:TRAP-type C4-dicarboxylate transport system substrate-binding protein